MKKKTKNQKEKEQLLKNKTEGPLLKEVIEFEDEEVKLIQDIPSKNIKKK